MRIDPFYMNESDYGIILKKDIAELTTWLEHLDAISEVTEYLLELEDQILHDSIIYTELQAMRDRNDSISADLYRYELKIMSCIECNDMQYDAEKLHSHEKRRHDYSNFLREYRELKKRILTKILIKARH